MTVPIDRHGEVAEGLAAEAVDDGCRAEVHGSEDGTERAAVASVAPVGDRPRNGPLTGSRRATRDSIAVTQALDDLVRLLDLEAIEVNIFRGTLARREPPAGVRRPGRRPGARGRRPHGRTGGLVHSLHAYFLRPGDPTLPILYEVDRIRDGRSFTTRRVVAIQHGRAIFNLQASFHADEDGLDHQVPDAATSPTRRRCPTSGTRMEPLPGRAGRVVRPAPADRHPLRRAVAARAPRPRRRTTQQVWLRADGRLPDDPVLHACIVTYASDMTLLDTTLLPHGVSWPDQSIQMASLDHAMWFHRPFRADEWLLYDQGTPSTSHARGLALGSIFTQDGRLVVSVVQEGLVRVVSLRRAAVWASALGALAVAAVQRSRRVLDRAHAADAAATAHDGTAPRPTAAPTDADHRRRHAPPRTAGTAWPTPSGSSSPRSRARPSRSRRPAPERPGTSTSPSAAGDVRVVARRRRRSRAGRSTSAP